MQHFQGSRVALHRRQHAQQGSSARLAAVPLPCAHAWGGAVATVWSPTNTNNAERRPSQQQAKQQQVDGQQQCEAASQPGTLSRRRVFEAFAAAAAAALVGPLQLAVPLAAAAKLDSTKVWLLTCVCACACDSMCAVARVPRRLCDPSWRGLAAISAVGTLQRRMRARVTRSNR